MKRQQKGRAFAPAKAELRQVKTDVTLEQLAASRAFDPDDHLTHAVDRLPVGFLGVGKARACRVKGCSVKYPFGGVCGYCRSKVKQLRAAAPAA